MSEFESQIRRADGRGGWVTFTRRTDEPKLTWLEQQLAHVGIESRRNGHSFHAPILEVRADRLLDAWAILEQPVGQLFVTDDTSITVDDLPDDHRLFQEAFLGQGVPDQPFLVGGAGPAAALPSYTRAFVGVERPVLMFDVDSSNLSSLGVVPNDELNPPSSLTIYTVFKGASVYRYWPFPESTWEALLGEAKRVAQGDQEASVGSLFHALVKRHTEHGTNEEGQPVFCEKYEDDGSWRVVPPKALRPKRGGKG